MSKDLTPTRLVNNIREDYRPTNTGEFMGGMMIICIALVVSYAMYLYNKRTSPTAKAELSLKVDLINELNDFKHAINAENVARDQNLVKQLTAFSKELARLDKNSSMIELVQSNQQEKMNKLEQTLNQNFTGLHDRFNKFEETLLLFVAQKNNRESIM